MKKNVIIGSLVAGAFLLPAIASAGVVDGRCDNCHTMHASQDNKDVFYDIQKRGVIKVGVSILPPWVMRSKDGGLVGFEIDIAKQLAKDMGVKVEYQAPPTFDMVAMSQLIDAAVASKPDGLVVSVPDADALGPGRQLLDGRGPERVSGRQQHAGSERLEAMRQLGDRGRLAGGANLPGPHRRGGVRHA